MLERPALQASLHTALVRSRVVALIGPRQSGKTTLARTLVEPESANYFDLEDPASLVRMEQPMTALQGLSGLVVIDEVQRCPQLFPVLRVLADRLPLPARFLVLGSASPALLRQSSESLAGRMEIVTVGGFTVGDVGSDQIERLWLRGGFPLSFLAERESDSLAWRREFVAAIVERDLPQLGVATPARLLRRFWAMLAHYHGQTWNGAELARSLAIGESSVRRYVDLLDGVFMVRQLQPWHENLKKRQVKAPKLYLRDTGVLHQLLGIRSRDELLTHPRSGASWEGLVVEQLLASLRPEQAWFWATHAGAELDLLLDLGGARVGVEIKRSDAPRMTSSMRTALEDLHLHRLIVAYPGTRRYSLGDRVEVWPLDDLLAAGADGIL